jgi:hypothetical protein
MTGPALLLALFFVPASSARASGHCPDARADAFVERAYPEPALPVPAGFDALAQDKRDGHCKTIVATAGKLDAAMPGVAEKAKRVGAARTEAARLTAFSELVGVLKELPVVEFRLKMPKKQSDAEFLEERMPWHFALLPDHGPAKDDPLHCVVEIWPVAKELLLRAATSGKDAWGDAGGRQEAAASLGAGGKKVGAFADPFAKKKAETVPDAVGGFASPPPSGAPQGLVGTASAQFKPGAGKGLATPQPFRKRDYTDKTAQPLGEFMRVYGKLEPGDTLIFHDPAGGPWFSSNAGHTGIGYVGKDGKFYRRDASWDNIGSLNSAPSFSELFLGKDSQVYVLPNYRKADGTMSGDAVIRHVESDNRGSHAVLYCSNYGADVANVWKEGSGGWGVTPTRLLNSVLGSP